MVVLHANALLGAGLDVDALHWAPAIPVAAPPKPGGRILAAVARTPGGP